MAFLPPEQQNQQAPQGVTAAGSPPPQTGGSAGGGTAPAKTSSSGTPTQFGSSASKLGDYLTANAPQITNQANQVTSGLNSQYGQIQGDITNAANQFGQQVSQGYAAPNQSLVDQAASNPYGFVSASPDNTKAFQAQYNDTYTGPQNYESSTPYGNIQNEVTNAVQNAGQFNTSAGLQNYFRGQGGNQTKASNTLDALLLQGNPQAQQQIKTAANQFQNLTPQFQQSTATADQSVQAAQQAAQQAQQYAQGQIKPVVDQFGNTLNTQLNNINTNRGAYNTAVTQNQTAAQQDQANLLAAQQAAQAKYQGNILNSVGNPVGGAAMNNRIGSLINPQAYLTELAPYLSGQPITQPGTLANTATTQQYQEDAALAQLLGQNYNPVLNQANASQAGSYTIPGMPGATPNTGGETQYIGDIGSLYGNPGIYNVNAPGGWQNATPQQLAQSGLNVGQGQGFNLTPDQQAALQRLAANQYAGRI